MLQRTNKPLLFFKIHLAVLSPAQNPYNDGMEALILSPPSEFCGSLRASIDPQESEWEGVDFFPDDELCY